MIEHFFLNSPICKQHINKVNRQSDLISNALTLHSNARILSIGCGTSEDLKKNVDQLSGSEAHITLVDFDSDALQYSMTNLDAAKNNIKVVQGNIYKIIKTIREKFDLILIGGVFDYLGDKVIVHILSSLKQKMNTNATIFFTNIKKQNPFRIYMEYLSDWMLIERNETEIRNLIKESGCELLGTTLRTDDTGLTYLVEMKQITYT